MRTLVVTWLSAIFGFSSQCSPLPIGEESPPVCSRIDCKGDNVALWGTVPATQDDELPDGRTFAMQLCHNDDCLPAQIVRPAPSGHDACTYVDGINYCGLFVDSRGGECGDEIIYPSGVVACFVFVAEPTKFPKVDGDRYHVVIHDSLGAVVVDKEVTAKFVHQMPDSHCDNSAHVSCENAHLKF